MGTACEDVKIHSSSGVAFLGACKVVIYAYLDISTDELEAACGDTEQRMKFYPPIQRFEPDPQPHIEYFIKYNIQVGSAPLG